MTANFDSSAAVFFWFVFLFFGVAILLMGVKLWSAYQGVSQSEKLSVELVSEGLCPHCGQSLPKLQGTNCPHCKNYVKKYFDSFAKARERSTTLRR